MAKYKVTYGWIKTGEGPDGMKGVGEIVELDPQKGDAIVESGCAERVQEVQPLPKAQHVTKPTEKEGLNL